MDETGYTRVDHLSVGVGNAVPIRVVCQNLVHLCKTTDIKNLAEESKDLLKVICNDIYNFLHRRILHDTFSDQDRKSVEDLKEHPIIYCHSVFVRPSQTALRLPTNCEPYLLGLQDHHLKARCKSLVDLLGIKDQFSTDDVTKVMLERQDAIGEMKLTEEELELYTKLIKVLVNCMDRSEPGSQIDPGQLRIPDLKGFLSPIVQLCLNDSEEIGTSETMKFVNGKIAPDFARALGVKAKIKQHFVENTRTIPFGQKEELTTRIKRILDDYPCDEGIMKELLQNADDAQATELKFIIDSTHHSTEKVFDDKWKPLQGPALLVYNDSMFSASDIQGIQDLGIGSKGEVSTKTGQYGVGFNAVYHLTDAPSFLTKGRDVEEGETLCVMDPYCQFISNATEERPGTQFVNLPEHRKINPDVFKCYYEDKLLPNGGTVFRFPLRTEDGTAKHLAKPISEQKLRNLFSVFEKELLETLLFVKSVKKISLSHISSGHYETQYEVETVISLEDEEKRRAFGNKVQDASRQLKKTRNLSIIQTDSVSYNITVKDSKGEENTWLIVQQIGFGDGAIPKEVSDAYKGGELGLLPIGGVAILLSSRIGLDKIVRTQKHRAFCFLPLPLRTGLPLQVNGHFTLGGETRSSLWNQDRGTIKWEWNNLLLSRVIPAAYIIGMERVKQMLLNSDGLIKKTNQLDKLFPMFKNAADENWKLLTTNVLTRIYEDCHELFYIKHETQVDARQRQQGQQHCQQQLHGVQQQQQKPSFVPLKQHGEPFPAVFDTLAAQKLPFWGDFKKRKRFRHSIQNVGLRLLDSPVAILKSMKDTKVPVSEVSPEIILEFLKSYDRTDINHKCNVRIQEDGTNLSETSFHDVDFVFYLLLYCLRSDKCAAQMIGLPLCLTQDRKLRAFREDSEIFCCEQFSILPFSTSRFLHESLVNICNREELQKTLFRDFDIPTFAHYLSENLNLEKFRSPKKMVSWYPKQETIPNSTWICKVWDFLVEQNKKNQDKQKTDGYHTDTSEAVRILPTALQHLSHWNLVPCIILEKTINRETMRTVLSSLSSFEELLDLESFTGSLKEALSKLGLPVLDRNVLGNPFLFSLLPHDKKPAMVLNCLYRHRNETGFQHIPENAADAILEYFVGHIKDVRRLRDWKHKLKSLPMHLTVHGEHSSLDVERNVLVLPEHIPSDGIKEWGQRSGTLLLKQNKKLQPMYDEFEYSESEMCDVYTYHILENVMYLPRENLCLHLEYIRDTLLRASNNKYTSKQINLISALGKLCIFETERGGQRCASELHSPHVPIFQTMKSDQLHFPKSPYDAPEWQLFMELIGMVKEPPPELILKFAHQIEREGRQTITEEIKKKSDALLECIWKIPGLEKLDLLSRIRTIKFIVPPSISMKEQNIFPQFESGKLMAFEGSVSYSFKGLVWSSCSMLTGKAYPNVYNDRDKMMAVAEQLRVCLKKPPLEKVIQHTQNICDALKEQCEQNCWQKEESYLRGLMSDVYKYLWENARQESILCERLRQKPLVYLPSENKFVTCGNLVVHLDENGEIKPYLYSAPMVFGSSFDLFQFLGTEQRTTCGTYARVLEQIKQDVKEEELHANEQLAVIKAIEGLFSCLKKNDSDPCIQVQVLYLPTEENKMVDSTRMIYSDSTYLYDIIGNEAGLPYFVGFELLKLNDNDSIKKLPVKYRPRILSKIVTKRVDENNLEVIQGYRSHLLQKFIQSVAFAEAIIRISNHDVMSSVSNEIQEQNVSSALQKINVLQVENLRVEYMFNDRIVGCSQDDFTYIHKEEDDQHGFVWKLFIRAPENLDFNTWLSDIEPSVSELISEATNIRLRSHGSLMLRILMKLEQPEMIAHILDSENYKTFRMTKESDYLPTCGTYVHEKWHHMLDNTTFTFGSGEFVALHLHDEYTMDSDERDIYIYAQIVNLVGSDMEGELSNEMSQYKAYVGEDRFVVKFAFEIYKILRKKTNCREVVSAVDVANETPAATLPLHVIFKEVRRKLKAMYDLPEKERKLIFKRYLRRWHPDKNIGNEEQATETFQYIKFVWDRLTNGDPVNIDDDVDPSSYSDSRPSANQEFYENVYRQCSREKEWYRASARSRGGRHRTHNVYDNDPVSNPIQQRKWFKQAELDICAAEHFMQSAEEVQGYNWICYMCHQAVEKSLKSIMYGKDANKVTKGHDIIQIAASLSDDSLMGAVSELHNLLGYHKHMRYPDVHAAGKIPSTSFTRHQAESAIVIAKKILEEVDSKN